jgi:hydroxymethylpyrimidine/phosphomethylpyrimidine kinase
VSEGNAQTLIKKSSLVIAFNSTTILEAGLLGRNVIIPVYAEAVDKYFNSNVYFKKYLDSMIVASSGKDLKDKVLKYAFKQQHFPLPDKMVQDFIGFYDGQSSKRILDEIINNK